MKFGNFRRNFGQWSSSVTFEDVRRCAKCAEGLANEAARQTSTSYFKATVMLMERFIEPLRREGAADDFCDLLCCRSCTYTAS